MPSIDQTIATYFRAWNDPTLEGCTRLLHESCTPDVAYFDPKFALHSLPDLAARIHGSRPLAPDFRVDVTTAIDGYDDTFRYGWVFVSAEKALRIPGLDVVVRAKDGRIATLTSFFGPLDTIAAGAGLRVQPRWAPGLSAT
jgi:hypothetical protein